MEDDEKLWRKLEYWTSISQWYASVILRADLVVFVLVGTTTAYVLSDTSERTWQYSVFLILAFLCLMVALICLRFVFISMKMNRAIEKVKRELEIPVRYASEITTVLLNVTFFAMMVMAASLVYLFSALMGIIPPDSIFTVPIELMIDQS